MIIVSNYSNFLTVSSDLSKNKGPLLEKTIELDKSILQNSRILNVEQYSQKLLELLKELKLPYKKDSLVFLVDPFCTNYRFIKNSKELDEQEEFSKIMTDLEISGDDVYFNIQKRTPLFNQFVSIDKNVLESLVEVASKCKLQLYGIFPYLSLFTKHKDLTEGGAIVSSYLGNIVVHLIRFGGIYFNKKYGTFENTSELEKALKNMREYQHRGGVNNILSFNFETPEISQKLGINEVRLPNQDQFQNPIHALAQDILSEPQNEIFLSNFNLMNLIETTNKKNPVKFIWKTVLVTMVIAAVALGSSSFFFGSANLSSVLSNFTEENNPVSEKIGVLESISDQTTPATSVTTITSPANILDDVENIDLSAPTTTKDLDKSKLKVQILNATGVSGVAARNSEFLKTSLGYSNISVGNTQERVQGTIVRVKPDLTRYIEAFSKEFLTFKNLKFETQSSDNSPFDLVIILGK